MKRQRRGWRPGGGLPVEEAPVWMLGLFAAVLWLVAWPALVGLLAGAGLWHGQRLGTALAAVGVAVGIVALVATRPRWRRQPITPLVDPRPWPVRFATWLIVALLLPNVLFGVVVLTHPETELTYAKAAALGLLLSTVQAAAALFARRRRASSGS